MIMVDTQNMLKKSLPLSPKNFRKVLWNIALEMSSLSHPWFRSIIEHKLTRDQVIAGEIQHFLRVMKNKCFFGAILDNAKIEQDLELINLAQENYNEEVVGPGNHTDLLFQLLNEAGIDRKEAENAIATPGTAIAIEAIIGFCQRHSALESMAFVGFVEAQNAGKEGVAYQVYQALINNYGFSKYGAETFLVHSIADEQHGSKQIDLICKKANTIEMQSKIIQAVQSGVSTFSIEWDGHLQAAIGKRSYWTGCTTKI